MLRALRRKLFTRDSSSQICGKSALHEDARALDKIDKETMIHDKETMNAILLAKQLVAVLNQIHRENLPCVVKTHPRLLLRLHADSAFGKATSKCGCVQRSIGIGTENNGDFCYSRTSLDASARAREKKQCNCAPEKTAKVPGTSTTKVHLTCDVVTKEMLLYARKSVILMAETSRREESLMPTVTDAKKKDLAALPDGKPDEEVIMTHQTLKYNLIHDGILFELDIIPPLKLS